jgi:hypothetical protein
MAVKVLAARHAIDRARRSPISTSRWPSSGSPVVSGIEHDLSHPRPPLGCWAAMHAGTRIILRRRGILATGPRESHGPERVASRSPVLSTTKSARRRFSCIRHLAPEDCPRASDRQRRAAGGPGIAAAPPAPTPRDNGVHPPVATGLEQERDIEHGDLLPRAFAPRELVARPPAPSGWTIALQPFKAAGLSRTNAASLLRRLCRPDGAGESAA